MTDRKSSATTNDELVDQNLSSPKSRNLNRLFVEILRKFQSNREPIQRIFDETKTIRQEINEIDVVRNGSIEIKSDEAEFLEKLTTKNLSLLVCGQNDENNSQFIGELERNSVLPENFSIEVFLHGIFVDR